VCAVWGSVSSEVVGLVYPQTANTQLQIVSIHFPINACHYLKAQCLYLPPSWFRNLPKTKIQKTSLGHHEMQRSNAFYMFYCAFFRVFKTMQCFAE